MNKQKKKIWRKPIFSNIVENIFFQGTTNFVSKIGSLFFTIIIARLLMPELFGIYSLAITILIILVTISDFGFGGSITRYLSESISNKKKKQARSRFWFLLKLKFLTTIIFSILLFVFAGLIAAFFKKPELILPLKIGSFYLFINSIYTLVTPLFLSVQKLRYNAFSELINQTSRIALVFLFFFLLKIPSNVSMVLVLIILSFIFSLIFVIRILFKRYSFLTKGKVEPVERRRILKFSSIIALSAFGILVFANIDKLVLGFFLEAKFLGFYATILSVISGVIGLINITAIFFPLFVPLKKEELKRTFRKATHYLSMLIFPASIGLAFIMLPLLKVLYGFEYVPVQYEFALTVTAVLWSLLILETIFSGFYKSLFDAKEKPSIPAFTNIAASILNLILKIKLIFFLIKINPSFGLIGAAVATFITRYGVLTTLAVFSKKKLNITIERKSVIRPLFVSILMLGYLILFKKFVVLNIFTGILMVLSAASLYVLVLYSIKGINVKEIKSLIFKKN